MPTLTAPTQELEAIQSPFFRFFTESRDISDDSCAYYAELPDGMSILDENSVQVPEGFRLLEPWEIHSTVEYQSNGYSVRFFDTFIGVDVWTECCGVRPNRGHSGKVFITNHPIEAEPWRVNFVCKLP